MLDFLICTKTDRNGPQGRTQIYKSSEILGAWKYYSKTIMNCIKQGNILGNTPLICYVLKSGCFFTSVATSLGETLILKGLARNVNFVNAPDTEGCGEKHRVNNW